MRFVIASTIAGLTVVGAASPLTHPPRDPVVILVHGRGHLEDDSAALRRSWTRDLDTALASVGMPALRDDDVRMAWYADVLDPESDVACATAAESSEDSLDLGVLARGFLGGIAGALPKSESRDARGLIGDLLYVMDWSKRCAAERRVGRAIEAAAAERRPVIVVAYSLGAAVTYSYLNARAPDSTRVTDLRLVTIGSPLAVPELRDLLFGDSAELRMPAGVTSWENVYDPDDMFSGPLSVPKVRDRPTHADRAEDAHHIDRYLRDRSTGAAVARALCSSAKERFGEACGRLPAN